MSDWQITNANSGTVYDPSSISLNVSADSGSTNVTFVIPDFAENSAQVMSDYLTDSGRYYSIELPSFTVALKAIAYYGRNIGANSAISVNGAVQYTRNYSSWAASAEYEANDVILVGGNLFAASTDGISGDSAPPWPTSIGSSVNDGSVTWVNVGPYYIGSTSLIDPFLIDSVISQTVSHDSIGYLLPLDDSTAGLWVGDYVKYDGETRLIKSFTYSIQPNKRTTKILTVSV